MQVSRIRRIQFIPLDPSEEQEDTHRQYDRLTHLPAEDRWTPCSGSHSTLNVRQIESPIPSWLLGGAEPSDPDTSLFQATAKGVTPMSLFQSVKWGWDSATTFLQVPGGLHTGQGEVSAAGQAVGPRVSSLHLLQRSPASPAPVPQLLGLKGPFLQFYQINVYRTGEGLSRISSGELEGEGKPSQHPKDWGLASPIKGLGD